VISDECWHADALSTALMVMGAARGLDFAEAQGLAARLVRRSGGGYREHCSRAWREMLQ
jgi:thiamine biosynthesis lipoprotein ApbE